jgi:hypothetical protein
MFVGAQTVKEVEGNTDALDAARGEGLGASDPPGSETRACAQGFRRNLGGPVASAWRAQPQRRARYRRAKATKRGGRGGEASEHLVVPTKRGNRPEGPRGGKGVP